VLLPDGLCPEISIRRDMGKQCKAWKTTMCLATCVASGKSSRHMKRLRRECMVAVGSWVLSEAGGLAEKVFWVIFDA
jgi:hypothetical protein